MKIFHRKKENFVCKNCGFKVEGNGYTNHCSNCLWSRHVDINPGDRKAGCGGMMKPLSAELKAKEYLVWHKCLKCGFKKKNKISKGDNLDVLINFK